MSEKTRKIWGDPKQIWRGMALFCSSVGTGLIKFAQKKNKQTCKSKWMYLSNVKKSTVYQAKLKFN